MEKSGFYDAYLSNGNYDRVYRAEDFANYFASFIGNGVFGGKLSELQVVSLDSVSLPDGVQKPAIGVVVASGMGWINGYWYGNTEYLPVQFAVADGTYDRIDMVVLRLGYTERKMWVAVVNGTPGADPMAQPLTRNDDYYELCLAEVRVKAGAVSVMQSDITDTRLDDAKCGLVKGTVERIDATQYGEMLNTIVKEMSGKSEQELQAFVAYLESIKQQLDDIISSNDISSLVARVESVETKLADGSIYTKDNPPPYPVTSVNGETGAVTVKVGVAGAKEGHVALFDANGNLVSSGKSFWDFTRAKMVLSGTTLTITTVA